MSHFPTVIPQPHEPTSDVDAGEDCHPSPTRHHLAVTSMQIVDNSSDGPHRKMIVTAE